MKKKIVAFLSVLSLAAMSVLSVGAADTEAASEAQAAFTSAINSVESSIMSYIMVAIPVALAIFGVIIAIKKGISFVKSLLGRAS